jgi:hypothetical protein
VNQIKSVSVCVNVKNSVGIQIGLNLSCGISVVYVTIKEGTWSSNTASLLDEKVMVLTKQHVSAYLEVIIIMFTNVGNRRLVYIAKPCG